MKQLRRGFTLSELVVILVVLVLLLLLPGLMKERWNADGLSVSLNNVRQIMTATAHYRLDNAGRVPMRGCGYLQWRITGGWSTWNAFGKNNSDYWQGAFNGFFDESAHSRLLNSYLQPQIAPEPPSYMNTGAGTSSTTFPLPGGWTFNHGTPTLSQRQSFTMKMCRSPGDVATRQRSWPNTTPGVSTYEDVGTSYLLNMRWWAQAGLPGDFTLRYDAGTNSIRNLPQKYFGQADRETFVWCTDPTADVVASSAGISIPGEFGGTNMSVLGFLSGYAAYTQVGGMSGPGYTFAIPWP